MKCICKKCNILYDYTPNCPNCGQTTIPVDKLYENKRKYQILLFLTMILAPFTSFILYLNNPFQSHFSKTIGTITFFIWGLIGYITFSSISESHKILFYLYQIINLITVLYFLKYFYIKSNNFIKILSIIYTLVISLIMLANSLNFNSRENVTVLHPDNNINKITTNVNQQNNLQINTTDTQHNTESNTTSLKMPTFEIVDSKLGSHLKSFAVYYPDQSKENIILAAKCWNRQKGNNNIFIYFVKDKSYKIDNRRTETEKVIAFYESTVNRSILYFLNSDGTAYETMNIK